ncbi:hypothetical protein DFH09DRAFT_1078826 [Mycena vulgaris]|nr:hypothetical protein DFH09DRAFT_1078826 [Mycena vulgaris]
MNSSGAVTPSSAFLVAVRLWASTSCYKVISRPSLRNESERTAPRRSIFRPGSGGPCWRFRQIHNLASYARAAKQWDATLDCGTQYIGVGGIYKDKDVYVKRGKDREEE